MNKLTEAELGRLPEWVQARVRIIEIDDEMLHIDKLVQMSLIEELAKASNLESSFWGYWYLLGNDEVLPVREHKFHPSRRWRFDFAWVDQMVAVECEGGIWTRGRHTRGKGFEADIEKYNSATAMGWLVFRVTSGMLERDPYSFCEMVKDAIERRVGCLSK